MNWLEQLEFRAVLSQYPATLAGLEWLHLGSAGGFSGASLWQGRAASLPAFCLKAWPIGYPRQRLQQIHQWMLTARTRGGLTFVPKVLHALTGETVLEHAGRVWDLTSWMPGKADFHANPSSIRLRAACEALAALHRTWTPIKWEIQPCPGVRRRLTLLSTFQHRIANNDIALSAQRLTDSLKEAQELIGLLAQALPRGIQLLQAWEHQLVPLIPCLCDLWHDHVLFLEDQVTGMIDFGAMKLDHPAVDLARMLGDFTESDPDRIREGLHEYQKVYRHFAIDEQLTLLLDRTGVLGAILFWLDRFREAEQPQPVIRDRFQRLRNRLVKLFG